MRVSARCEYACKALLELAMHWPSKEPLHIGIISRNQNIPIKYLVHILIQLKRIGLVESIRGKEGGYNLAKPPDKIRLGEVIREIGGPLLPVANSNTDKKSFFAEIWQDVEKAMRDVLDKVTFADVVDKAKGLKEAIVYQI